MGAYNTDPSLIEALQQMQARLAALETKQQRVTTASANPSDTPAEGTIRGAKTSVRLYLYLNGTWRYTTLT